MGSCWLNEESKKMNLNENLIEAASYYGHVEVVEILKSHINTI